MRILDLILSPWAITPEGLTEIHSLVLAHRRGEKVDLKAWEAASGRPAGSEREPYQVVDGVAVIPLQGVMTKADSAWNRFCGMTSTGLLRSDLQTALQDPSVHSILLWVDSPGGQVDGTQELADAVFAARAVKPIVSLADGCMCSAAMWVGAAAEKVYITSDTTATGSIGVVTSHVDISRAEEQWGQKTTEITAGKYKRIASQYAPLSEEGRAAIQAQLDHIYSIFVDSIATFRGVSPDVALAQMAEGRVFLGKQGIEAGLVDGVSSMSSLITQLNQERRSWTPGAGAASQPSTTHMEEPMPITREQLQAEAPELLNTILADGQAQGRAEELARVTGCRDAAIFGYEKAALEMAFDGKTTPAQATAAINALADADLKAAAEASGRGPTPATAGHDAEALEAEESRKKAEAKEKPADPSAKDWTDRITAHMTKAAAEGRKLTSAQAAHELRKQDEEK